MSTYVAEKSERTYDAPLADFGTRFMALVIDGLIIGVMAALLSGGGRNAAGTAATFVIGVLYQWYFLTQQNGQTPGKKVMNIRVVKITGEPLTFTDALLRYVGYYIDSAIFGIGWFWAFFDADRQAWHDKLVSTVVVRA